MSGLGVGFSPPHPAPERVKTRGWARDDVLPGINARVSSATHHILPTPIDCGRMANHGHCGAAAADILGQDISANVYSHLPIPD
jgi:hypothetical protein